VWDVNSAELVFEVPGTGCGRGLDIDPAGKLLSVQLGETVGNVQVWELDTGRRLPVDISHPPALRGAAEFDPARGRLLTAGADGRVRIWDVDSGESLMRLEEHDGAAESAVWSPDGAWIATGDAGGTIRLWDAATGDIRLRLPGHAGFVLSLSFSPDGRRLISSDDRGDVRVWAIDPDDLIELASERLTRDLTDAECDAYHFDECPSTR
jgi:WD40 repeat protein